MRWVMDMSTGKVLEDEFGAFENEVLNAEWLPPSPELQLALQEVHATSSADTEVDTEAFLNTIYRNQG
jgi:hypothetical protein